MPLRNRMSDTAASDDILLPLAIEPLPVDGSMGEMPPDPYITTISEGYGMSDEPPGKAPEIIYGIHAFAVILFPPRFFIPELTSGLVVDVVG